MTDQPSYPDDDEVEEFMKLMQAADLCPQTASWLRSLESNDLK